MSNLLILIDGSAIAYRSYYAFIRNPLINSKGENTSAVFGFTNSLIKLIEQISPSHIACVFDTPAPTFRHKLYTEYKSTRAKMPDELADSLPWIKEIIAGFNIPLIEMEGFEADDIIGTLSKKAALNGFEVGVKEKMGVLPDKIIDLLALMGDSSDNIPGVPGVGEKTALKLLNQFGDFETVLQSADKVTQKKIAQSLKENAELARLSFQLVTIDCDVPVEFDDQAFALKQPSKRELAGLFKKFELSSLYKKYSGLEDDTVQKELFTEARVKYETVKSVSQLDEILTAAENAGEAAIDTETTSINALNAELVGISIAFKESEAFYIPLKHNDANANLPFSESLEKFSRFFSSKIKLTGHNLKFDRQVFDNYNLDLQQIHFDTMIASYLLDPGRRSHKLDSLAVDYFNYKMQPITELIGKGSKQLPFSVVPIDKATFYAAEDADFSLRLKNLFSPKLEKQKLEELFYDIEMPLLSVLGDIEKTGVAVDLAFLKELSNDYGEKMAQIEGNIYEEAGQKFNINSPAQLRVILFDKLGLPSTRKTTKGREKSTDVGVLKKLALIHPLPRLILNYRLYMKLRSTYINAIPKLINSQTGRVHTSFNQTVTATGRLSSSDPNLQNIPIRTEEGREIRKAFIAGEGFNILSADYSQVELRLMAHFAKDKTLIESFKLGEDIHKRTAAEVFGIDINDVTSDQRRSAKTANFAIIYGVSAYGLSQQAEMSVNESKEYIDAYFERYTGVKKYMDDIKAFARQHGYVETLLERRRYLPDINARSRQAREFAERTAINTPIQGTAADLIKLAMIRIADKLKSKKSKMILQVHDELVFEQYLDEREFLKRMVKDQMENALKLDVPIKVDLGEGDNWLEAH